jgi:hypothetical protein
MAKKQITDSVFNEAVEELKTKLELDESQVPFTDDSQEDLVEKFLKIDDLIDEKRAEISNTSMDVVDVFVGDDEFELIADPPKEEKEATSQKKKTTGKNAKKKEKEAAKPPKPKKYTRVDAVIDALKTKPDTLEQLKSLASDNFVEKGGVPNESETKWYQNFAIKLAEGMDVLKVNDGKIEYL